MERLKLISALAWRNLWRNPRRTGLVLVAVSIGVWSMLSFTALLQAWSASSLQAALENLTGQGQVHASGYLDNPGVARSMPPPAGVLRSMLDGMEVDRWAPRVRVPAAVQSAYKTWPVSLVGIDPERERGLSFIATAVHVGRGLDGTDGTGILLGRKLAKRLHTGIGKRVVLMSQNSAGGMVERGFKVVGLFLAPPQIEDRYVFIGLARAQTMLGMGENITGVSFGLHRIAELDAFIGKLRGAAPGMDVQPWQILRPLTKAMNQLSSSFIQVWIVIIFVLMSFGIVNTLLMSLHERVRELALLQALGLRPRLIFAQVVLESALVVLLGIAIGVLAAAATVLAFHRGIDLGFLARGSEWLGAGRVLYPQLDVAEFAAISALVWALGVAAGLLPIWRIIRRVPVEAINRGQT